MSLKLGLAPHSGCVWYVPGRSGEASSKDGSNVTQTSSGATPIDSRNAVQCEAVTKTSGSISVPLQRIPRSPSSFS